MSLPMLDLSRTLRFCLNDRPPDGGSHGGSLACLDAPRNNTFSAWPAMRGLGRYYELTVSCFGEADPLTGYFINIKHIDTAAREHVFPYLAEFVAGCPASVPMGEMMQGVVQRLQPPLHDTVHRVQLNLTPYLQLQIEPATMHEVVIRQRYEFSAAHRLHVESYSDAENQSVFGKCNNPAGHGHNYQVEVAVRCPVDPQGRVPAVQVLDATVDEHCIQLLDHKHLNIDVPEFAHQNPSVENIVQVVWRMLQAPIAAIGQAVKLDEVSVWETSKTVCTYRPAEAAVPGSVQAQLPGAGV